MRSSDGDPSPRHSPEDRSKGSDNKHLPHASTVVITKLGVPAQAFDGEHNRDAARVPRDQANVRCEPLEYPDPTSAGKGALSREQRDPSWLHITGIDPTYEGTDQSVPGHGRNGTQAIYQDAEV